MSGDCLLTAQNEAWSVLLHNENECASIPVGYSVTLKESYENVKDRLETLKYTDHGWMICVDLKMMNFLLGQQGGYTKYPLRIIDSSLFEHLWGYGYSWVYL